ncbi:MAG: hypothetical protein Ta2A_14120 [Treponemataceae bacterium]|nr:MAG: hypothetical protein Ta2A_14120 [Treponemataceae bacterium]
MAVRPILRFFFTIFRSIFPVALTLSKKMKLKTVCCVFFFLIVCSQDRTPPAASRFKYEAARENFTIITGFVGTADSLTVPSFVGDLRVASIAKWAFVHVPISELIVSEGILAIGESAFAHGKNLKSAVLPNSLTSIGIAAFQENKLNAIVIPANVTTIGEYAFSYNNITQVTFSPKMKEIPLAAFYNNNLTSIRIPDNILKIEVMAFAKNLITEIYIPANVNILHYDEASRIKVNVEPEDNIAFEYKFEEFYAQNEKKAGRYHYRNGKWRYEHVSFTASVSELPPPPAPPVPASDKKTDAKN